MSPWLRPLRPDARVRLFCLPYAGGGVAEFARWRLHLPADIEVLPVALPGREGRLNEPAYRRVGPLAEAIAHAISPALDRPYAIYGHSMGAAVAFAVVSALHSAGRPLPAHLFLAARGGPGGPPHDPIHGLDDAAFLDALQARYEALPAALLADRELLAFFLPALRADMELVETAALAHLPRVPVPTTAFVGSDHRTSTHADAARWASWVGEPFTVRTLPGGHFFLRGPNLALLGALAATLAGVPSRG